MMVKRKEVVVEALAEVADEGVSQTAPGRYAGVPLIAYFSRAGELISPWWSRQRDAEIRRFWKQVDMLAGAIYMMTSRLSTIPWKIYPKDLTIKRHVDLAIQMSESLQYLSSYGKGWSATISSFVEDLITQDNGGMLEIIGEGDKDGPLTGAPLGVAHLDSWQCMRTSDWEYPIMYTNTTDGKKYKLHYTRVAYVSQMPSPLQQMYGVGMCAVSRCLNVSQHLLDVMVFKQEKLGSRPHRGLLITKGGLDPEDLREAFMMAEAQMDNQLLRRYAKMVAVGHEDMPDASIEKIDLASLPDGFSEAEAMETSMAAIALAFGVDPRELWPGLSVYATRAEALLQHTKQRGKAIGQILSQIEHQVNWKFLPNSLVFEFDYQDDEQDKQRAEIRNIRAQYYNVALQLGVMDARTMREQQLADKDITEEQFNRLEARDGRLPDGTPILTLFYDPDYDDYLSLGVEDVLNRAKHSMDMIITRIDVRRDKNLDLMVTANHSQKKLLMNALAALDELEKFYSGEEEEVVQSQQLEPAIEEEGGQEGEPRDVTTEGDNPPDVDEEPDQGEPTSLDEEDLEAKGAWGAIRKAADAIRRRYVS